MTPDEPTQRMITDDGVAIAYRTWGEPGRTPVLLHHGFVSTAERGWVRTGVAAALVAAGRHVVAHDARGHGESDKPHDPARYGEQRMARDLSQLADALQLSSFDLVGFSMGAVVALHVAAEGTRVRRLVVSGIGSGVVHPEAIEVRAVRRAALAEAMVTFDVGSLPTELLVFRRGADTQGADRLALAAHARREVDEGVELARVLAPTLVLAGGSDVFAAEPDVLAAALPAGELQVVPGDHLTVVRDPAFAPAVVSWLAAG